MRRLILVAVLVTVLLVAFAGSALADGPHGYGMGYGGSGYGSGGYGGYNMGYGGYNMGYGGYGGYKMQKHYPKYNYCCYVYNPCPTNYGYQQNYGYVGAPVYGGYGMQSGYMASGGYGY